MSPKITVVIWQVSYKCMLPRVTLAIWHNAIAICNTLSKITIWQYGTLLWPDKYVAWYTNMLGGANTSPLPDTYMLPGISKWQVEITICQVVLGRAKGTFWAAARYQDWEESGEASSSVFHHNHPHKHDHHHGHHHYHRHGNHHDHQQYDDSLTKLCWEQSIEACAQQGQSCSNLAQSINLIFWVVHITL